ncbi:hypothetical protein HMPREF9124_0950 [Oribacterium sp. oral taxon 108 str. F0425]|nr:hypothetical protein HMPREF9124_0950 [Oribacterium sp. oral taxon 108 str. F0425]
MYFSLYKNIQKSFHFISIVKKWSFYNKIRYKGRWPGRVADYLWYDWKNLSQTDSS